MRRRKTIFDSFWVLYPILGIAAMIVYDVSNANEPERQIENTIPDCPEISGKEWGGKWLKYAKGGTISDGCESVQLTLTAERIGRSDIADEAICDHPKAKRLKACMDPKKTPEEICAEEAGRGWRSDYDHYRCMAEYGY